MVSDALHQDLCRAYGQLLDRRRRRTRLARLAAVVGAGSLVLAVAALGAAALLGWPAPDHVKREIAAVDRGFPADLRLNPDVVNARAVASTGRSTLYAATLRDGGHCTEIVTADDRGRGVTCTTALQYSKRPIDVALPADEGAAATSPVVLAGRVNARGVTALDLRYSDGSRDAIPFGEDRFFIFDVPEEHLFAAHSGELELIARRDDRSVVARATIPADWDDAAVPDERNPLFVSTRSDESDFTKVYGLEGHVSATGAVELELDYGDGTSAPIPIQQDGSYEYTVPAGRVDDFMQPKMLLARDRTGRVVASAPVAAVAYWRGRERRP
jgi:hypothetical protein